jgi:thiamine transport system substrate-binding protein
MVLSYTTSPAYHLIAEEDDSHTVAAFEEGHYIQVEVAGIVNISNEMDLARQFMDFILTPAFQEVIPTTNWMYPAALPAEDLPAGFETLVVPEIPLLLGVDEAQALRQQALDEWQAALSQ